MATPKKNVTTDIAKLKALGVSLPKNPKRASAVTKQMHAMASDPGRLKRDVKRDTKIRKEAKQAEKQFTNTKFANVVNPQQMEQNMKIISQYRTTSGRGLGRRIASSASDVTAAIPRFFDPLEYWDLSGMPFNMADEGHRHKLHKWMRLYYATHSVVPTLVDIFTRFPLSGLELTSPDRKLTEFYESLFLDNNRLNYEDFLVGLGREYWLVGEAFPLASFNEDLGIFDSEELLNPEDIVVERVPMLGATYLKVKPPESMVRLVKSKSPAKEYKKLQTNFPELIPYLLRGQPFEISPVLLKHIKFALTDWDDHGTPILLRALRWLMHEEKLLASQDAIAERLYSPLILAKLGIQDLGGGQGAWFPGPDALDDLRDAMDLALASDFRLLVHHFGLDISNVFGREQMPDLSNDFDRVNERLMMVFGVNPGLLSGGQNAQPYASSALQAEFMNQMLKTYQKFLKDHYMSRALIVAEAQEHWDYEKRGDTRIPIMEEVLVEDPETGKQYIEQRHKLMVPEMDMAVLDLRDEATERQYLMALRQMGLPISDEHLMVGLNFEFVDSLDEMTEEAVQKTVAMQMGKIQVYKICLQGGLPIPPELKAEVESIGAPSTGGMAGGGAPMAGGPMGGGGMPGGGGGMGGGPPQGGNFVMPNPDADIAGELGPGATPGGGPPTAKPMGPGPAGGAPDVSSERRPGLSSYQVSRVVSGTLRTASYIVGSEGKLESYGDAILSIEEVDNMQVNAHEIDLRIEVSKRNRFASKQRRVVLSAEERMDSWHMEDHKDWDMEHPVVIKVPLAKKAMNIQAFAQYSAGGEPV